MSHYRSGSDVTMRACNKIVKRAGKQECQQPARHDKSPSEEENNRHGCVVIKGFISVIHFRPGCLRWALGLVNITDVLQSVWIFAMACSKTKRGRSRSDRIEPRLIVHWEIAKLCSKPRRWLVKLNFGAGKGRRWSSNLRPCDYTSRPAKTELIYAE